MLISNLPKNLNLSFPQSRDWRSFRVIKVTKRASHRDEHRASNWSEAAYVSLTQTKLPNHRRDKDVRAIFERLLRDAFLSLSLAKTLRGPRRGGWGGGRRGTRIESRREEGSGREERAHLPSYLSDRPRSISSGPPAGCIFQRNAIGDATAFISDASFPARNQILSRVRDNSQVGALAIPGFLSNAENWFGINEEEKRRIVRERIGACFDPRRWAGN